MAMDEPRYDRSRCLKKKNGSCRDGYRNSGLNICNTGGKQGLIMQQLSSIILATFGSALKHACSVIRGK